MTDRNIAAYINQDGPADDNTIYYCDDNAGFVRQLDTGNFDADGDSIDLRFHSKYFTFDSPNSAKIFSRVKLDSASGIGSFTFNIIKNLNDAYTLPIAITASGAGSTFATAILGVTPWTSQDKSRLTTDVALPSALDGFSISYEIKHQGDYDSVVFYGFSLAYAYKKF